MTEKTESSGFSSHLDTAQRWVEETASGVWQAAENPWATAGTVALIGVGGVGLGLRMAGYGYKGMVARQMMQEAEATILARNTLSASVRDEITGLMPTRELVIRSHGQGADYAMAPLLRDMQARGEMSFSTYRNWVTENATGNQLVRIDPFTEVARLPGGSGVVLRSDHGMSIVRNNRSELQIIDHVSGEATLFHNTNLSSKTVVFPNGRVSSRGSMHFEGQDTYANFYGMSARGYSVLDVLKTIK